MAISPAHRLGQIIGDQLELAIREPLEAIAREFGLYLDYKHARPARAGKTKVAWTDSRGNVHDLDYVLEEGGDEEQFGSPRAFIESAWRRYTKHSRNKAQEIQGAIVPLADTHTQSRPFLGVVLAGEFTEGSLNQFRSHGFSIVHCPYVTMVRAFADEGVNIATDEHTDERHLQAKVNAFGRLTGPRRKRISQRVRELNAKEFDSFFGELRTSLKRTIKCVFVLMLSGTPRELNSIEDAVRYVERYDEKTPSRKFVRYELNVRYTNGDEVRGTFQEKRKAIAFLESLKEP